MCKKIVLDPVPQTQHRPIGIQVNTEISTNIVPFQRRFNYKKADWNGFTKELDQKVKRIAPTPDNYDTFAQLFPRLLVDIYKEAAGWNTVTYQAFTRNVQKNTNSMLPCLELTHSLRKRQQKVRKLWNPSPMSVKRPGMLLYRVNRHDRNSKKAWSTIPKLQGDPTTASQQPKVTPDHNCS